MFLFLIFKNKKIKLELPNMFKIFKNQTNNIKFIYIVYYLKKVLKIKNVSEKLPKGIKNLGFPIFFLTNFKIKNCICNSTTFYSILWTQQYWYLKYEH